MMTGAIFQAVSAMSHAGAFDLYDESARTASGFFVGITGGNTRLQVQNTPLGELADKTQTLRLLAGYRFNRYLDVEGFSETGASFATRQEQSREPRIGPETVQGFGVHSKVFGVNVLGTVWSWRNLWSVNIRAGAVFANQRITLSEYTYGRLEDQQPPQQICSGIDQCVTAPTAEGLISETHRSSSLRLGGYSTGVGVAVQFMPRLRIAIDTDWRRGINSQGYFDHTLTLHSAEQAWSVGVIYGPF
jgi:hypothetical protein